ncbi:hypothetical protein [Candidatus Hodarchaeum mangrovi]
MALPEKNNAKIPLYQNGLRDLYQSLIELKKILKTPDDKSADELYKHLVTIEDALETLLNWIKLEKNGLRNFETILEWTNQLAQDGSMHIDELRSRLRTILLPQVESFTQNLATGEKSALKVLDVIKKNLESVQTFLKMVQQQNFKLLTMIGYEPQDGTSHLDLALFNLYQGRIPDFNKELSYLKQNLQVKESNGSS